MTCFLVLLLFGTHSTVPLMEIAGCAVPRSLCTHVLMGCGASQCGVVVHCGQSTGQLGAHAVSR